MTNARFNRIWLTVATIPEGRVAAYGQIATLAGLPGRARWVGKVVGLAPNSAQIPWYRVVRASGELAFPLGSESAILQTQRLAQENVTVRNNRIVMANFQWQPTLEEMFVLGIEP